VPVLVQEFLPSLQSEKAMQGFITEPKHILAELIASRENGNVIGIWANPLGTGLYMCGVENILDDDVEHDKVILLKEKDLNGVPLQAHVLFLQEIEKVYPLKTMYGEPSSADAVRFH
jgi:hypothetical protein